MDNHESNHGGLEDDEVHGGGCVRPYGWTEDEERAVIQWMDYLAASPSRIFDDTGLDALAKMRRATEGE